MCTTCRRASYSATDHNRFKRVVRECTLEFPDYDASRFCRAVAKNWLRRDHRNSRKYTIVTITAAKIVENIIDQVSIRCSINQWLKLADEIFAKIQ